MDSYIQFPRYSIYLIPNKLFIEQVEKLLLKNNMKFDNSEISKYGLHYTVKAPFYLSHLYNEDELIKSFQEYFLSNQHKSYNEVLILCIEKPGESGQVFLETSNTLIDKINNLKNRDKFNLCVDGGLSQENISKIQCEKIVSASNVIKNKNPKKQITYLQKILNN